MLKQTYKYLAVLLLAGMVAACSPETLDNGALTGSDVPVLLNGAMTRSLGDPDDPGDGQLITSGHPLEAYSGVDFYLTARTLDTSPVNYFLNSKITIGAPNLTNEGRNKLDGNVYYPLGQKEIDLYAHTVPANGNGVIILQAGTKLPNDVLLGRGTEADGLVSKTGNSADPVKFITFKHLMTRVDMKIEVDDDVEVTKPKEVVMRFVARGENKIVDQGTYNIFNGGKANNSITKSYEITISDTTQTHYLVPNGANLSSSAAGQILSFLRIDHYVATQEELQAITFPKAIKNGVETDFVLSPGLAYDLTFKINRLKIVKILLTLKDWNTKPGEAEWDYEPKTITLNSGTDTDYQFATDGMVTQMVLKYKQPDGTEYRYIGKGRMEGDANKIDFVTLPADPALPGTSFTADLYTSAGLLVDGIEIAPSGDDWEVINLGRFGMRKVGDTLEISTPLQFALMLNSPSVPANQKYSITKTLDMGGVAIPLTPGSFPSGSELDGKGNDILNLSINGNGLFRENQGVLKSFRIASGIIKGAAASGLSIGAVCGQNSGTIEAVVNQANVQPASGQTYAGGIAGINGNTGKITASVNSGNILGGDIVGGIVGQNLNTGEGAVTASVNTGMLHKEATLLGGIIGTSGIGASAVVKSSFWLTGTARKDQAAGNELAIGNQPDGNGVDENSAGLVESSIRGGAIDRLNTALTNAGSPWKFEMNAAKSSWPTVVPNP